MEADRSITQLLQSWRAGDAAAGEQLAPLVYDELHRVASRLFRSERHGHTLQPTALVNEAYTRLVSVNVDLMMGVDQLGYLLAQREAIEAFES